jgi:hypothetical protein
VKLLTIDGEVPQALVGDEEHPPVVGPAPTNLELARAVAFILRKAMNLQDGHRHDIGTHGRTVEAAAAPHAAPART